ncbi:hypothetical protein HQ393_10420 [Chitinibacter bivalviorum]|uniref:Uncharacterized protein n=1 Tax=Chitinibacter bivalviorum TaxID=2739434 RepID=A0A7H9BK30_9NEIS|nr:hypothetical protein [Chitinibacter bivalviorum]QLG88618.1 hypothetical protein HQ393_10420 [Chitinibacter bivalviorum]
MKFSSIQSLIGWAFQMDGIPNCRAQQFGDLPPGMSEFSIYDLKVQAALVLDKVNKLPSTERALIWVLHLQRETEMRYLADKTPGKYGIQTDVDLIRKWTTGKGHSCREIGERHNISATTAGRYERKLQELLDGWAYLAYATLEIQHRAMLDELFYGGD